MRFLAGLLAALTLCAQQNNTRPFNPPSTIPGTTTPTKGPNYGPGTAVINAQGTIDAAAGPGSNCVLVNGTSAACAAGGNAWGGISGTLSNQMDLNSALLLKAALASPAFTGTPTAPTAAPGTNTQQLATTAFVLANVGTGGGSVLSVALTLPSWLTVAGSPITTSGTFAVTPTAAQTSHQVIGTCGSATTFAPCALVAADLPSTAVTPGGYTSANITVDQQGRITAAANGSGGSSAFSAITGSTNSTAAMVVGTGASLAASGSGTIAATAVPVGGVSGLGTGVGTALGTAVSGSGAICLATGSACAGGGSNAFSAITASTNTTAAMVVGTGASIAATGSGTITATAAPVAGITGLGTGCATWLATPSSANLAGCITDETGSGLAVFGTSPTIVTPTIASFTNATHNHSNAAGGGTFNTINSSTCTGTPSSSTFLRGDCTWSTPSGSGTVTVVGAGSLGSTQCATGGGSQTIQTPSVNCTVDSSGNLVANSLTAGTAPAVTGTGIIGLTESTGQAGAASADAFIADSATHRMLLSNNNATAVPVVVGPASATSGHVATFNGTSGGIIQDGGVLGTAAAVSSTCSGDLSGTLPGCSVAKVNGISYSATAAAHSVEVVTTANTTATAKVIPDCTDTAGNHLNFTQSTDAFSCGTSGGGVTSVNTLTGAVVLFAVNAQTSTYTATTTDFSACKTIAISSGTFTVTLVASGSQPPTGQCVDIINYGSGVPTLARNGQNINGAAANLTGTAGSSTAPTGWHVVSDGTNYIASLWSAGGGGGSPTAGTNISVSGTAVSLNPFDRSTAWWVEDFLGGYENHAASLFISSGRGWSTYPIAGSGATVFIAGVAQHPGILRIDSGATSGAESFSQAYAVDGTTMPNPDLSTNTNWEAQAIFRIQGTTGANINMHLGFMFNGTASVQTNFIGIRFDNINFSDTQFTYECTKASTTTNTASGTNVDTAWHRIRIWSTVAGTINFSLDGGGTTSISTNVPVVNLGFGGVIQGNTSAANKQLDTDWISFLQTGLTR